MAHCSMIGWREIAVPSSQTNDIFFKNSLHESE
jgi:hypothetical protein